MTMPGRLARLGRRPLDPSTDRRSDEPVRPRWSRLPPGRRAAALVLIVWSLGFPLALASLLGPEPASDARVAAPVARNAATADTLDAILQRPLFSRSRRAPAPAIQAAPMVPAGPVHDRQLVVRGIVIRDDAAKAFITAATAPQGLWVGVGDAIGGWHVAAIRPRDVELRDGTEIFAAPMSATGGP